MPRDEWAKARHNGGNWVDYSALTYRGPKEFDYDAMVASTVARLASYIEEYVAVLEGRKDYELPLSIAAGCIEDVRQRIDQLEIDRRYKTEIALSLCARISPFLVSTSALARQAVGTAIERLEAGR